MKTFTTGLDGVWKLFISPNKECKNFAQEIKSYKDAKRYNILEIDGTVPGNFELDMMNSGLLEDLFFGNNTLKAQELENRHLWYCRDFNWKAQDDKQSFLHFEGIDTVSEIYLNGEKIGETDNMLIAYDFDVTGKLLCKNELVVHIKPTCLEAQKRINEAGCYGFLKYNADSLSIRKAAHSFGWDIMPRIVSGGIWRGVSLVEKAELRIEDSYIYTVEATENRAQIWGYYRISPYEDIKDCQLRVSGKCGESTFNWQDKLWFTEGKFSVCIDNPKLWWPKNMGEPNLYDVTIELWKDGKLEDKRTQNLGVRKVELIKTAITDQEGSGEFCFKVNGKKMFVMGTNWVPLDAFHSRDKQRLQKAMALVDDIGINMIRCWGGNVYEDKEFFDYCDKLGIAVWQDFAMGCAIYPQNKEFCDRIEQEAEYIIKKLRNHPSLFLWAGDNEVDEVYTQWTSLICDPNTHNKVTRKILPEALIRLDPVRPYLPSSPFVDSEAFEKRAFNMTPERHLWGPRDYFKGKFYNTATAHFASETGYHGCPSPESMKKFLSPEKLWGWENNDEWLTHATCVENRQDATYAFRIPLMANQVKTLFGEVPDNLEDFALASQLSQGEADKFFIERFRTAKWRRTGIIWWNLLDGWPQISDAVVDYYFVKKASYDFIKRSQNPICLMFKEPQDGALKLIGANELPENKKLSYTVTDLAQNNKVLSGDISLEAFGVAEVAELPLEEGVHFYLIEWECDGIKLKNHYISGGIPYDFKQYVAWLKQGDLLTTEGF